MRALLALCCAVALGGCAIVINPNDGDVRYSTDSGGKAVEGNQQLSRDARAIGNATTLDVGGLTGANARIEVRVGPASSLVIEADSNLLPLIQSEVSGNTLRIWSDANLRRASDIHIIYTTPHLLKISTLSGGAGQRQQRRRAEWLGPHSSGPGTRRTRQRGRQWLGQHQRQRQRAAAGR